ncbi:kinase-like domain-containing protein [Mycena sanguinolenta]|nr:kinase-like domain-containing protein [Mycena sanguinolenta]
MSQGLRLIDSILSDRETYEHFLSCRGTVAQRLLDLLQDLLDSSHELSSKPSLSKALVRLSGECGIYPTCFTLEVKKVSQQVAGGGFGDIWKGLVGGQTVAVKSMRQFADDDVKASIKKLGREALIWRQLSHPNLLPFFGMYMLENRLCLISPWMDNGDLKNFLNNPPIDIDRVALIVDVAQGLEYLHSKDVVHGDLKTVNILVTPSRRACITDFGLSSIVDELSLKMSFSSRSGRAGTVRYQAPELLKNESSTHFGSDVYAFACVGYEVLTGKVPFYEVANEAAIICKVVIDEARPLGLEMIFPDDLRLLLEDCWNQKAETRPTSTAILRHLLKQPTGDATHLTGTPHTALDSVVLSRSGLSSHQSLKWSKRYRGFLLRHPQRLLLRPLPLWTGTPRFLLMLVLCPNNRTTHCCCRQPGLGPFVICIIRIALKPAPVELESRGMCRANHE